MATHQLLKESMGHSMALSLFLSCFCILFFGALGYILLVASLNCVEVAYRVVGLLCAVISFACAVISFACVVISAAVALSEIASAIRQRLWNRPSKHKPLMH